jgi:hypothetical protein
MRVMAPRRVGRGGIVGEATRLMSLVIYGGEDMEHASGGREKGKIMYWGAAGWSVLGGCGDRGASLEDTAMLYLRSSLGSAQRSAPHHTDYSS